MTGMIISYRLPNDEDIADLAARLRQADIDELALVTDLTPEQAIIESIRASDRDLLRAYHADGVLVCITGCSAIDANSGRPWLLATDLIETYRFRLQRETLGILDLMLRKYAYLTNVVDQRNTVAVEWLKSLGFEFYDAVETGTHPYLRPFGKVSPYFDHQALSAVDYKQAILNAEQRILSVEQTTLETVHHFAPGIYARELRIPKGTVLSGKVHKTRHLCILSAGAMQIFDENGERFIGAGDHFISEPGTKRLGLALDDVVFTTIHASELTDIVALETTLVCDTEAEYAALAANNPHSVLESIA